MIEYSITNKFVHIKPIVDLLEQLSPTTGQRCTERLYHAALEIFDNQHYTVFIATNSGVIIGTAMLRLEYKLSHNGQPAGHIEDVVVDKQYRGQGVGKELVKMAIEKAKENHVYKVTLNCFEHNVGFYKQLGFRQHDIGMRIDYEQKC